MASLTPLLKGVAPGKKRKSSEVFTDSPFVIPPSPFMKRLGCGTSVTVYRFKRPRLSGLASSPWAIKKANRGQARPSIIERLTTEGEILRKLNHPNIVAFKKLTTTDQGDVCLSMEQCGKGLDDVIIQQQENELPFNVKQMMLVACSIAKALDYIHNTHKLLHGDVKSGNVLVKGVFEHVKLCDFGVSIFLKDDLSAPLNEDATYVGSEPWHSPEVIEENIITDKADIFAYGLTIWEMLALDVPHVALMTEEDSLNGSFTQDSICQAYFDALGTRPPLPDIEYNDSYDAIIGTFLSCTNENHLQRPNARLLVENLSLVNCEVEENKENICSSSTNKINAIKLPEERETAENNTEVKSSDIQGRDVSVTTGVFI